MKKIISIVAILLCFATSYAQETKPTKQETMDWIAGKMKQYLISPRIFQSYSEGIFTYKKFTPNDDESYGGYNIITIDLNKITNYVMWVGGQGVNDIEGAKIIKTVLYDEKNKYMSTDYGNIINMSEFIYYQDEDILFDFSPEKCLNSCGKDCRLRKALDVLLKFNIPEGEKF